MDEMLLTENYEAFAQFILFYGSYLADHHDSHFVFLANIW